jgi:hypothetical protein
MGWVARFAVVILVLLVLGAGALAVYAGSLSPPHQTYRVVLPNDRFPS